MNKRWMNWMCAGLVASAAACGSEDVTDTEVADATPAELGTQLAAGGKADAAHDHFTFLRDGRVVFRNQAAAGLVALGEAHPATRMRTDGDYNYAQSPFAYCATRDEESVCISLLADAEHAGDEFEFGGNLRGRRTIDTRKAVSMVDAMSRAGFERNDSGGTVDLTSEGNGWSCWYTSFDVSCGFAPPAAAVLTVDFDALPVLGDDYLYEGWLILDGAPVSAGRFDASDAPVTLEFPADHADSAMYVLTIEPRVGDDPAPSATHIVAGAFEEGEAALTIDHPAALGTDFGSAMGTFILAAPTADDQSGPFDDKGIWFVNPSEGTGSLDLPTLPDGWAYEGWVATDNGPISTGRFTDPNMPDSDGAGPAAGPNGAPPVPGQDFVDPPMSLLGNVAVISVEPDPDDSPAPFALKPLVGMIEDAGKGVPQMLDLNGEAKPAGTATLELR